MSTDALTREEVRERLRGVEAEVLGLGVRRLALFGSVLRNEARPDSDVDFLVEFAPAKSHSIASSRCPTCLKLCSAIGWNS